ncbi:hypothetical protein ACFXPI_03765 [Streptomyces sp. NPDC059104]|uniref:hypothetical protein n=1 Tax=Streptomyces sp. NPDC059104 TaxID=3346729 RepID=UPI0036C5839A
MTDALLWIGLICAALGTAITAWTSSGVGRMHYTDSRELRRAQCFKDVLSRHVDELHPGYGSVAEAPPAVTYGICRGPCDVTAPGGGPCRPPSVPQQPQGRDVAGSL